MITFIALMLLISSIGLSRFILGKWFNHIMIYAVSWFIMAALYDLRFLPYVPISMFTWSVILYGFLTYILGALTVYVARKLRAGSYDIAEEKKIDLLVAPDSGRILKAVIIIYSTIGLVTAIQHWYVLIKMLGSIGAVLVQAQLVYRYKVKGGADGSVPYFQVFAYSAVFFAAVYSAYKRRIVLLSLYPLLAVMINEFANFGRAGILMSFLIFFLTYFLAKPYFNSRYPEPQEQKMKNRRRNVIAFFSIVFIFVLGTSFIRSFREDKIFYAYSTEKVRGAYSEFWISPTLYMYMSSHIVVLSKYFEKDVENGRWGENTFQTVYVVLSKMNLVEKPEFFYRGYLIPMWTNTATYLREIHLDFGDIGLLIIPYILGLLTTFFWFRFYSTGGVWMLVALVFLNIIVSMSFLAMISRVSVFSICLVITLITCFVLQKFISNRAKSADELALKDSSSTPQLSHEISGE